MYVRVKNNKRYLFVLGLQQSVHQLTAADCLDIADVAHHSRRYVRMKEWLIEAERLIIDPQLSHRVGNTSLLVIYEFRAWGAYLVSLIYHELIYYLLILSLYWGC